MQNHHQFIFSRGEGVGKFDFGCIVIWFHLNDESFIDKQSNQWNRIEGAIFFQFANFSHSISHCKLIQYNFAWNRLRRKKNCVFVLREKIILKHTSNRFRPEFVMVFCFLFLSILWIDIQLSALGFVLSPFVCPATPDVVVGCIVVTAFESLYYAFNFPSHSRSVCLLQDPFFLFSLLIIFFLSSIIAFVIDACNATQPEND